MAKKIIITTIASLLSFFFIFILVRYSTDILQPDAQTTGPTESTDVLEVTDPADIISDTTLPNDTTVPEPQPQNDKNTLATKPTDPANVNTDTSLPDNTTELETKPTEMEQPPSQESTQPQELPKWKQMYINHATVWRTKYDHFALVYIDGDDIPELYMYGNNQSELCAFRNDAIYSLRMNGMGGGNYHKKSGHFLNVCAEGEYLAMYVYELTDTFRQVFYGREDKSVDPPVYYIGKYTGAVSEAEFKDAVNQYIDTDKTEFLHQNAVSFDAFPEYVTDF